MPHGWVYGTVTDRSSGNPVANGKICFDSSCVSTDSNGNYHIYLEYSTYDITVQGESNPQPSQVAVTAPFKHLNVTVA